MSENFIRTQKATIDLYLEGPTMPRLVSDLERGRRNWNVERVKEYRRVLGPANKVLSEY